MNVEEMLEWAVSQEHEDLQHLILFLVYEKKTLSLDDPSEKIQFYTQDKFKARMNELLSSHKKKFNAPKKKYIYSIVTQKGTVYALAYKENDASYLIHQRGLKIISMEVLSDDYEMVESIESKTEWVQTTYTVKELKERADKIPSILGGI